MKNPSSTTTSFHHVIMTRFKTLACFGYGISAGLLLYFLSIDLAHLSEKKLKFEETPEVAAEVSLRG